MEELLYHVWKNRLYQNKPLLATDGTPLEVIDPGQLNIHAGPDFFNAKIKIGDTVWVGNVEIHNRSADWYHHNHHLDRAYDSVILHVVKTCDAIVYRDNKSPLLQLQLDVDNLLMQDYEHLKMSSRDQVPCANMIPNLSPLLLADLKTSLAMERLHQKANNFLNMIERYRGAWEEVFYITLARSLGTGINGDAFERLARSLPSSYWLKHTNSLLQMEALFLGQGGFLNNETIEHPYYLMLRREYLFLAHKFKLKALPHTTWKSFRTRPAAFPQIRIVYLATLLYSHQRLFDQFYKAGSLQEIKSLLRVSLSSFWDNHYQFEVVSIDKPKGLGELTINSILINAYIPMLFAYAQYHQNIELSERAIALLESIKAENNLFVRRFREAGISVCNAFDSQALIQLHKSYCEPRKCIYCRLGHQYLGQKKTTQKVV